MSAGLSRAELELELARLKSERIVHDHERAQARRLAQLELQALNARAAHIARTHDEEEAWRLTQSPSWEFEPDERRKRRPTRAELKVFSRGAALISLARQVGDRKTVAETIRSMAERGWVLHGFKT